MSYYKVTFESDTLDGLKALQGDASDFGSSAAQTSGNAATAASTAPPPQPDDSGPDGSAGAIQAPPAIFGTDTDQGTSDAFAASPPPTAEALLSDNDGADADPPPLPKEK